LSGKIMHLANCKQ